MNWACRSQCSQILQKVSVQNLPIEFICFRPHPYELIGKHCNGGVCIREFSSTHLKESTLSFADIRIEETDHRLHTMMKSNPLNVESDKIELKQNMNVVRLCYQVILLADSNDTTNTICLPSLVTKPILPQTFNESPKPLTDSIIDNKKVSTKLAPKIQSISETFSSERGGKKILIFCQNISRKDIQICFYEENSAMEEVWVSWGRFERYQVYGKGAIAFKTPKYEMRNFNQQRNIFIELRRPSDGARSNRLSFQYVPDVTNVDWIMWRKRMKIEKFYSEHFPLLRRFAKSDQCQRTET